MTTAHVHYIKKAMGQANVIQKLKLKNSANKEQMIE